MKGTLKTMKHIYEKETKTTIIITLEKFTKIYEGASEDSGNTETHFDVKENGEICFLNTSKRDAYDSIGNYLGIYIYDIHYYNGEVWITYSGTPSAKEAYRTLSAAINNFGFNTKEYLNEFQNDHRYLQGEVFQLAKKLIALCAKEEYMYDGRNEFAVKQAKSIVKNNPDEFYY